MVWGGLRRFCIPSLQKIAVLCNDAFYGGFYGGFFCAFCDAFYGGFYGGFFCDFYGDSHGGFCFGQKDFANPDLLANLLDFILETLDIAVSVPRLDEEYGIVLLRSVIFPGQSVDRPSACHILYGLDCPA